MKIVVSACLLGETCRYDGQSIKDNTLFDKLQGEKVIPFCPEAPVLGTPRAKIYVMRENDGHPRIIQEGTLKDVTSLIVKETLQFLENNSGIERAILKSKSPSCGIGTTPHFDTSMKVIGLRNGIAADLFIKKLGGSAVFDENSF